MPRRDRADRSEYMRAYYRANREKLIARAKAWNASHPEEARQRGREWYARHGAENRERNRAKINSQQRAWVKANPEAQRADNRKQRMRRFGLTVEIYEQMSAAQGGRCAVCEKPETRSNRQGRTVLLAVDHDHATGAVRALLCSNCNTGLGSFLDDPALLRAAAGYIERFRSGDH